MPVSHIPLESLPTSLPQGWTAEDPRPGDPERALDEPFASPKMNAALGRSLHRAAKVG